MVDSDEGRIGYVKRRLAEAQTPEEVEQIEDELIDDEKIPRGTVSRVKSDMKKCGELPQSSNGNSLISMKRQFPQRLGRYDVLTPEAVLDQLRLQDGDYKVGFVDGIAMLLLAARLNQELATTQAEAMTPMIKMLQTLREEERVAAERSKASASEAASIAAQQAVSGIVGYLDQKLPKGPPPKDTNELFTKRIDKMWDMMDHMMEQKMFPQAASKPPEGWEYEKVSNPVSSPPPQNEAAPQNTQSSPQGWAREQEKEEQDVQSSNVRSEPPANGEGSGGRTASQDGSQEIP
ncbi:hypothetical protein VLL09_04920 [Dehalococcoides mccartyi]|uniref:Uncharacterized protein n=1 Tax=Dehalococcoides mccartyi TaxID=61435 RepID=A0AB38Z820_9CHLR|nr:hypothetical protein [Dehalococcoides mccartyi]WRO06735.1 hypothetical protein VLL09_04920 [Dehalococcoides mccartyi]